ncbi:MAG: NAD(+) diphosphatase [Lachnospiraceae bacterium]|nr:NAD(+) diphosphatase [Lachnospiraceae bacterium]
MIQDIEPHIYHNEYHVRKPQDSDYFIGVKDGMLYMAEGDNGPEYIRFDMLPAVVREDESAIVFLFQIDDISWFLADPQAKKHELILSELKKTDDIMEVPVQEFRQMRPMWKAFAGITAVQLNNWYSSRKFCGRCGSRMEKSIKERAMICPECGLTEYPRICPAVIIAVTNGDRLMMTKYAQRAYKNYALVAGFTEIGESFEETVKREVMEEVGLKVKNITYYKSQPWSFSDTILAGFFCQLDGSDEYHMDTQELSVAEWISRDQLPDRSHDISLTSEMIEAFRTRTYPQYENWEGKA